MSNDIKALNQQAEARVVQAHSLLVLLQHSDMSDRKNRMGSVIVDQGVVYCALEGIAHLLDEARDLHGEIDSLLGREEKPTEAKEDATASTEPCLPVH